MHVTLRSRKLYLSDPKSSSILRPASAYWCAWMDSIRWHYEPLGWAAYVYSQTAPQTGFRGRMAVAFYLVVIWAFGWYDSNSANSTRMYFKVLTRTDPGFSGEPTRSSKHPTMYSWTSW